MGDSIPEQHGTITRDQFIEHNIVKFKENRHEELWTVDRKHVYSGYNIFCYLKPLIELKIQENGDSLPGMSDCTEDECSDGCCHSSDSKQSHSSRLKKRLLERQKRTFQHVKVKKPFNHILHHLSVFRLSEEAISVAKERATIAELSEDPKLSEKDEEHMKLVRPYLESVRRDDHENEIFYESLEVITRDQFIEHNKSISDGEVDDHVWTHDGKIVYDGVILHNMVLPFMKQQKLPYYITKKSFDHVTHKTHGNTRINCIRNVYKPHFKSYSSSFHFMRMFDIPREITEKMKRETAIGRLVDDPGIVMKDREQILELIETLQLLPEKTDIIQDLTKCAQRHYENSIRMPCVGAGYVDDVIGNDRVFIVPSDADMDSFRQWPNYMWHDRDPDRKWIDDWTPTSPSDCPGSESVDNSGRVFGETGEMASCWHTPWRESWPGFDVEIRGEAAWEVIPGDVIKNDQATLTQLIRLEKRRNRTNLTEPDRMAKMRQRLSQYFRNSYGFSEEAMSVYSNWSDHMTRGWEAFTDLCNKWHYGYVQERSDPQLVPATPEPWQIVPSPEKILRLQNYIFHYFMNHKFIKHFDPEQHRKWMAAMQEGWHKFQNLCETWTSDEIPKTYKLRMNSVNS